MKIINNLLVFILFLTGLANARVVNKIIAKVNGQAIKFSEYEKNKNSVLAQYQQFLPDFLSKAGAKEELDKKVLEQMIDDELLRQEAERRKIKVYDRELDNAIDEIKGRFAKAGSAQSEELFSRELEKQQMTYGEFREKIRRQLMSRKLIDRVIAPKVKKPTEEEIKNYYQKILHLIKNDTSTLKEMSEEESQLLTTAAAKFKELVNERIRLSHIFIKAPEDAPFLEKTKAFEKAKEIKKRLEKGEDFEELAEKYSQDKESAAKGGDLGYLYRGMLPEELEKDAFSMRVGKISGPIKSKFGYHIIKLQEKRARRKLKYNLVKDDISQLLSSSKFTKELLAFVKQLREKADIKIFTEESQN